MLDSAQLSKYPLLTSFTVADTLPAEKVLRLSFKRKLPADFNDKIVKYKYLQELHLKSMRLKAIPQTVWSLHNLTVLDVSNNKLTEISDSLGELLYLERLIINRNDIAALPKQISQLTHLRYIDMFSTQIADFPPEISLLENTLKEIDMRIILMNDSEKQRLQNYLPKTKFLFSRSCNCKW
jgi:Leucine-rich repeat (LRR) protein